MMSFLCTLLQQNLRTSGSKNTDNDNNIIYIHKFLPKEIIPEIIMSEPMMLLIVIVSAKTKWAMSSVKTIVMLLLINAMAKGNCFKITCHKTA